MQAQLEALKTAAQQSAATKEYRTQYANINGHTVSAVVAHGFRNTGKDSVRWKVDGKVIAAAKLMEALA